MAYWLMICRHRPGMADLRAQVRDDHRMHVASGGGGLARVLTGSALTQDDGETAIGNFGVLEAESREKAQAFAEADPYARAGLVETIEIVALASRFQADRIDPLTRPTDVNTGIA
ncbi:YciI family protein [Salinarimonas soli]|uniref:YCII-related domain-containing protein n=1 Tax=Salinarimonas soli TaxID=1638099 RepID=A0A5B2V8V9_9HYPH|nr:YciI family protein [Salinarimonas soli]KAA2235444.1 hypothetical protein F0L46_19670 [Salinarimonas soli]